MNGATVTANFLPKAAIADRIDQTIHDGACGQGPGRNASLCVIDHPALEYLTIAISRRAIDIQDQYVGGIAPYIPGPSDETDSVLVGKGGDGRHKRSANCPGRILVARLGSDDRPRKEVRCDSRSVHG